MYYSLVYFVVIDTTVARPVEPGDQASPDVCDAQFAYGSGGTAAATSSGWLAVKSVAGPISRRRNASTRDAQAGHKCGSSGTTTATPSHTSQLATHDLCWDNRTERLTEGPIRNRVSSLGSWLLWYILTGFQCGTMMSQILHKITHSRNVKMIVFCRYCLFLLLEKFLEKHWLISLLLHYSIYNIGLPKQLIRFCCY